MRRRRPVPVSSRRQLEQPVTRLLVTCCLAVAAMVAAPAVVAGSQISTPTGTPVGSQVPASCPVTIPNGDVPPFGNLGFFPGPVFHGENGIWASFGADGTVAWMPAMGPGGGSYGVKFLWFHDQRAKGHLQVTGTYLGGSAPPLVANVPGGYGSTGYQASGLEFSRLGCWRITASAGGSSMTFTIWLYEGMPKPLSSDWISPTPPSYCHITSQPTRVSSVAIATGPADTIAVGNDQLAAFLPPNGTFEVTGSPSGPRDALSTPFQGMVLTWWQNPLSDIQPLISAESTIGYGGSGTIDYDLQAPPPSGMRRTPVAFSSPGCWQMELVAGDASVTFTIWLWTKELPPVATPVATPAA